MDRMDIQEYIRQYFPWGELAFAPLAADTLAVVVRCEHIEGYQENASVLLMNESLLEDDDYTRAISDGFNSRHNALSRYQEELGFDTPDMCIIFVVMLLESGHIDPFPPNVSEIIKTDWLVNGWRADAIWQMSYVRWEPAILGRERLCGVGACDRLEQATTGVETKL